jgi:DNA-directed RNA polymerase specialized sigma24 family protein
LDEVTGAADDSIGIIELDTAIDRLIRLNERMGRIVELRVFGGLSHPEIAEAMSVSLRTVGNDWSVGRRWLAHELDGNSAA